jgi:demethylmenaquinone methyltransferase/2-methoxy-6-polyprenyl-1,4-benzoquinol methylase
VRLQDSRIWIDPFGEIKEGNKKMPATGARPAGAPDEASAAAAVRQMFDSIAPRYDLLNHVLSANLDRLWWRKAARRFAQVLARPEAAVLDICCGTGDLTMALLKLRPRGARPILAGDFAPAMLRRGAEKFGPKRLPESIHGSAHRPEDDSADELAGAPYAVAIEADALHLPMRAESLDLIVTAFGFRNLANYEAGLKEFYRALKPGGQLGILEFSEPGGILGKAYGMYFRRVLPAIGRAICGKDGAYNYLPTSVGNFPRPDAMVQMMRQARFEECSWQPYTFGIAGLYTATRPTVV